MSKRTLALIFVLIIVTAVLVVIAVTPQKPETKTTLPVTTTVPSPTPFAESTLSFNPNPVTPSVTSNSSVNIDIDTGVNSVTAVQLELQYDPKVLKNVDIALSSFFQNPIILLKKIDPVAGRVSFAFGINPSATAQKGKGTVAALIFQTNKQSEEQETTISFLPKTLITAEGVSQSVLKSSADVKVILASPLSPTNIPVVTNGDGTRGSQ